jgi:branched-subunit amino acid ABC-type transport system permease component
VDLLVGGLGVASSGSGVPDPGRGLDSVRPWSAPSSSGAESLSAGYLDPVLGAGFSSIAPYALLLVVLFVRPHGLFGRPRIVRV